MFVVMFIRNNKVEQYDTAKERANAAKLGRGMVAAEDVDHGLIEDMLNGAGYYHHRDWSIQVLTLIAL